MGLAAVVRRNPLSLLELGASLGPDHGCTLESPFQNSVVGSASWGGGRRPCSKRGSGSPRSPTTSRAQRACAGERTVPAAPLAYALIVDRGPSPAPVVAARQGGCGRRVVTDRAADSAFVLSKGRVVHSSRRGSPSSVHRIKPCIIQLNLFSSDEVLNLPVADALETRGIARAAAKPVTEAPDSWTSLSRTGGVIRVASLGYAAGRTLP